MAMDSRDDGIATPLLVRGEYEPGVTHVFRELVRPGMTVIDVGANFGYFALIAAQRTGPAGRVLAFEPEPASFGLLVRNIEANGHRQVTAVNCALGDHTGEVELFLDAVNLGRHSLTSANLMRRGGRVTVAMTTLDAHLEKQRPAPRPDVIKIDVQGAEGQVLLGAAETLRLARPRIILELWPHGLRNLGADPEELLGWLRALGYRWDVIEDSGDVVPGGTAHELVCRCDAVRGGQGHLNLLLRPVAGD